MFRHCWLLSNPHRPVCCRFGIAARRHFCVLVITHRVSYVQALLNVVKPTSSCLLSLWNCCSPPFLRFGYYTSRILCPGTAECCQTHIVLFVVALELLLATIFAFWLLHIAYLMFKHC